MNVTNSQRKVIKIWSWLLAFFIGLCFLPAIADLDMMDIGFAIIFLSGFCVIVCIIVIVIYVQRAKQFDELINDKNILARWTLSPQEWSQYAEYDYQEDKNGKLALFYLISVISLVIGILLSVLSQDILFFYIILGIIAMTGITACLSIYLARKRNQTQTGSVILSIHSVLLNDEFHNWTSMGAKLESLTYIDDTKPTIIALEYSFPSREGRSDYTIRIPVPSSEKNNVIPILKTIIAANQ